MAHIATGREVMPVSNVAPPVSVALLLSVLSLFRRIAACLERWG
ncbi:hypothetical protein RKLH11_2847 [Rhodobacteraceae bacterium KLH11]|nr:hypothetical protein RKLH11_2847 [Rhodobacteraceae bacterium KLH11]